MHKILILSAIICIAYLPSILSIPNRGMDAHCYGCSFINNLELNKLAKNKLGIILKNKSLTKREMDDQIEDFIRTQSPSIKEKFRKIKDQDEQKEIDLRRKIQLVAEKLSPEARAALQQMQAVLSNKDLTVAESITKFQEIRKALPQEIRTEVTGGLKGISSTRRVVNLGGSGRGNDNSSRKEQTRGHKNMHAGIIHLI